MTTAAPDDDDMSPRLELTRQRDAAHIDTTLTGPHGFAGLEVQRLKLCPFRNRSVFVSMRKVSVLVGHVRLTDKYDIARQ